MGVECGVEHRSNIGRRALNSQSHGQLGGGPRNLLQSIIISWIKNVRNTLSEVTHVVSNRNVVLPWEQVRVVELPRSPRLHQKADGVGQQLPEQCPFVAYAVHRKDAAALHHLLGAHVGIATATQ